MILKTTTNEFCFINVSFYETIADPRHFFEQDYEEMPEYEEESDSGYDVTILLNMYLTLAFVKEFGFKAGEAWSEITEYAYGCLSYSDFATTEMLIPEGSEHLFKDIYTERPTNYIIMSWINSDGRGVIRNISQKQNYARC